MTPGLTIVAVGDFGRAVADRIAQRLAGAQIQDAVLPAGLAGPVVLASWRESRALGLALDAMVDVPWWIPVVLAHPVIRVGPLLTRDVAGCYGCLLSRSLASEEHPDNTRALWGLYDHVPSAGPLGYLEHHAGVAAGLTAMMIDRREQASRRVLSYHVLTADLRSDVFMPMPDCPRWSPAVREGMETRAGEDDG
ncbi:TOMM precursor leader peptide-binding protein [Hamadaea sp. NPDC051192]|uniref:TOMM precursor leader peptide-binding protein n=1 Tax=Hamadaea sp. NPDC051192 TaxID=3154940 RepID=UPI003411FA24